MAKRQNKLEKLDCKLARMNQEKEEELHNTFEKRRVDGMGVGDMNDVMNEDEFEQKKRMIELKITEYETRKRTKIEKKIKKKTEKYERRVAKRYPVERE